MFTHVTNILQLYITFTFILPKFAQIDDMFGEEIVNYINKILLFYLSEAK